MSEKKVAQKKKRIDTGKLGYIFFMLIVFVICWHSFHVIFFRTSENANVLEIALQGGQQRETGKSYPIYVSALEAKSWLPADAKVNISPQGINIYRLAAKYFLQPLQLSNEWDFYIDFDHTVISPHPTWSVLWLTTGVPIYVKPERYILEYPKEIEEYSPERFSLIFFAVTFLNLGIGSLLLYLLSVYGAGKRLVWFMGTSYIVGILLVTIILWLFLLIGGALEQNTLIILWVMAFLGLLVISKRDELKISDSNPEASE